MFLNHLNKFLLLKTKLNFLQQICLGPPYFAGFLSDIFYSLKKDQHTQLYDIYKKNLSLLFKACQIIIF